MNQERYIRISSDFAERVNTAYVHVLVELGGGNL